MRRRIRRTNGGRKRMVYKLLSDVQKSMFAHDGSAFSASDHKQIYGWTQRSVSGVAR